MTVQYLPGVVTGATVLRSGCARLALVMLGVRCTLMEYSKKRLLVAKLNTLIICIRNNFIKDQIKDCNVNKTSSIFLIIGKKCIFAAAPLIGSSISNSAYTREKRRCLFRSRKRLPQIYDRPLPRKELRAMLQN